MLKTPMIYTAAVLFHPHLPDELALVYGGHKHRKVRVARAERDGVGAVDAVHLGGQRETDEEHATCVDGDVELVIAVGERGILRRAGHGYDRDRRYHGVSRLERQHEVQVAAGHGRYVARRVALRHALVDGFCVDVERFVLRERHRREGKHEYKEQRHSHNHLFQLYPSRAIVMIPPSISRTVSHSSSMSC